MIDWNTLENLKDAGPLQVISHPPFSTIHLQSIGEYLMPDASPEKIMEFVKIIQSLYREANSD